MWLLNFSVHLMHLITFLNSKILSQSNCNCQMVKCHIDVMWPLFSPRRIYEVSKCQTVHSGCIRFNPSHHLPPDLPSGPSASPTGVVVPYTSQGLPTGALHRAGSNSSLKDTSMMQVSFTRTRTLSCGYEESESARYMQSLPTMEGPVTFVAPELAEEVLMDVSSITTSTINFIILII